jgi:hypothetical protein
MICLLATGGPRRLQDRLHQRGDAAISRHIPIRAAAACSPKGVHDSGVSSRARDYVRVGVECEIAVRLARDLRPAAAVHGRDRSRKPSRPIIRRSRSSMTAMSNGRRWARRRWSRTISSPPAACSASRCRARRRRICSTSKAAPHQRRRSRAAAPAPTCSAIPTTRSPGSPTISPPRARACTPGRSC